MKATELSAREHAEAVLAGLEAALRVAAVTNAPAGVSDELRAIHRRLHQRGLGQERQRAFF